MLASHNNKQEYYDHLHASVQQLRTSVWRDGNFQMLLLMSKKIILDCIFCMSIAYETWYWPIHVLCLCITSALAFFQKMWSLIIHVYVSLTFFSWYRKGNCIHLSNSHSKWNGLDIGSSHHQMLLPCQRSRQKTQATIMKSRKRRGGQENSRRKFSQ